MRAVKTGGNSAKRRDRRCWNFWPVIRDGHPAPPQAIDMKRDIPHGLSVYLDLVRFGAATIVVLSHLWLLAFPAHPLP